MAGKYWVWMHPVHSECLITSRSVAGLICERHIKGGGFYQVIVCWCHGKSSVSVVPYMASNNPKYRQISSNSPILLDSVIQILLLKYNEIWDLSQNTTNQAVGGSTPSGHAKFNNLQPPWASGCPIGLKTVHLLDRCCHFAPSSDCLIPVQVAIFVWKSS